MSGGSMNYCYSRIDLAREELEVEYNTKEFTPLLMCVRDILKAIEWETSGDTSRDDTIMELQKFKRRVSEIVLDKESEL